MSCYLTEAEEIGKIAEFAFRAGRSQGMCVNHATGEKIVFEDAQSLAKFLAQANIDSCQARYSHHGEFAGGFLDNQQQVDAYLFDAELYSCIPAAARTQPEAPADHARLVGQLEYQTCEIADWKSHDAYWVLSTLRTDARIAALETLKR